jgi:hypothetical protein
MLGAAKRSTTGDAQAGAGKPWVTVKHRLSTFHDSSSMVARVAHGITEHTGMTESRASIMAGQAGMHQHHKAIPVATLGR